MLAPRHRPLRAYVAPADPGSRRVPVCANTGHPRPASVRTVRYAWRRRPQMRRAADVPSSGDMDDQRMAIGTSLLLIAAGAILRYAVTAQLSGIDLHAAGVVLIVVGIVGLVI